MSCVDFDETAEQTYWEIQALSDNCVICNPIFTNVVSSYRTAVVPDRPLPTDTQKHEGRGRGDCRVGGGGGPMFQGNFLISSENKNAFPRDLGWHPLYTVVQNDVTDLFIYQEVKFFKPVR